MVSMKKAGGNWGQGDRFFDQFHQVEKLAERIRTGGQTSVGAPCRMGKTSLCLLLEDWWRNRYGRTFVPIAKGAP